MKRKDALKYNHSRSFLTKEAARAFCQGIAYVNDAYVNVVAIRVTTSGSGNFTVYCLDRDSSEPLHGVPVSDRIEVD